MFSKFNTSSGLVLIVVTCFAVVSATVSRTTLTTLTTSARGVAATHARQTTVTTRKPLTGSTTHGTGPTPIFPTSVTKATRRATTVKTATMQFETPSNVNKTLIQTLSTEPTPASGMPRKSSSGSANSGKTSDSGSASTDTHYNTLLAFVASDTVILAMVVVAIVIAGICIYGKRERKLIWMTDLEGSESSREKNRASDHVVPRGGYVAKDVTSEPGEADNAEEAENYDVVGDVGNLDDSGRYTSIHPVINRTRSIVPVKETAEKKKGKRDRREGDRIREREKREKKKTSDQMELNVSSTTTTSADATSGHVDGDDPNELYENWSAP